MPQSKQQIYITHPAITVKVCPMYYYMGLQYSITMFLCSIKFGKRFIVKHEVLMDQFNIEQPEKYE